MTTGDHGHAYPTERWRWHVVVFHCGARLRVPIEQLDIVSVKQR